MLDDLRRATEDYDDEPESDPFDAEPQRPIITEEEVDKLFLGMTAVERMFLSIFIFMNVTVLGIALLIATNRIVF